MNPCPVCLEEMGGSALKTPCNHEFHRECIRKAVQHGTLCPICRAELESEWVVEIVNYRKNQRDSLLYCGFVLSYFFIVYLIAYALAFMLH